MIQDRTENGRFAPKSNEPRRVRTIRLTDATWEKIGFAADKRRVTRADLVEQMTEDGAFDNEPEDTQALSKTLLIEVETAIEEILNNSSVTRNGRDKGAVNRGLQALLHRLKSVYYTEE
jgi:predicted DNA-binding ribbon-helix-helix protein